MSRFHITEKGFAAPCNASLKACPRGGSSEHFDSLKDATVAVDQRLNEADTSFEGFESHLQPKGEFLTVKEWEAIANDLAWSPYRFENNVRIERKLTEDQKRRAWPAFIKGMDRNPRGSGIDKFGGADVAELSEGRVNDLLAAQLKPIRTTPTEKKRIEAICAKYNVTQEDVEKWAAENVEFKLTMRGRTMEFHPSRLVWLKDPLSAESDNPAKRTAGYTDATLAQVAEWKAAGEPKPQSRSASFENGSKPDDRDPRHPYGMTRRPEEAYNPADLDRAASGIATATTEAAYYDKLAETNPQRRNAASELAGENRQKRDRIVKELDPAMIEALKLKYLKRFKVPFDESGLSIPELLQMAQRGELG